MSCDGTDRRTPPVLGNATEAGGTKVIGAPFTGLVRHDPVTWGRS
jgi:hypothetical protein